MGLFSGIGDLFGLNGDQGEYYKANALQNKGTQSLAEMLDAARSDDVKNSGNRLVAGGSLEDALKGLNPDMVAGLASSPIYGNIVAQQQVQNDPLMSGLFNKGGSRDQALSEESRLRDQGFKLTPEDHEAYGQASGNIARMFGQQEQSLSSALANRGLSAAPSGAAGAQFTGLQGNKNEQLGRMQMDIANQRMQNTMSRLADVRNYSMNLANLGQNAESNAFNHNMAGANSRRSLAESLASNSRGDYDSQSAQNQAEMTSKLANKKKNLGDAVANGLYTGVQGGVQSLTSNAIGGPSSSSGDSGGGNYGIANGVAGGSGPSGYSVGKAGGMYRGY